LPTDPPARPLRLCFVCDELPPAPGGGIGSYTHTLGKCLRELGHEVLAVGLYPRRFDWDPAGPRVEAVPLPARGGRRALHERLVALHQRHPLDLVEWPSYQGPFLRAIPGVTDIIRLHSWLPPAPDRRLSPAAWLMQWRRRRALQLIPNWSAPSRWALEQSQAGAGCTPKRAAVIPNPVDVRRFHPPPDGVRRAPGVLFVGAFAEHKGAFALARALSFVLKEFPAARARFIGRDPEGNGAERIREILGEQLAARVEIRGQMDINNVAGEMQRARIVAMPGTRETFGLAWAEAMASGAAVIGSTAAAGPETVTDGEAGLLVPPESEDALISALRRLLADDTLCERLGRRGRELAVERYALEKVAGQTLEYYRRCLGD